MAFVVATVTMAKPVNIGRASDVASRFFPGVDLRVTEVEHIYLFSPVEGQGFVLVAADDCVRPVLAYSYTGSFIFDNMPEHIRQWLEGYERDIAARVASGGETSPEIAADWQRWLEGTPKSSGNQVEPLLTTIWGQSPYYNAWCPYDTSANTHAMTGCAATATAQVMKYWNHPATGMGSHVYTSTSTINGTTYTYDSLSANFGATHYDWAHMPDSLYALSDSLSINAVAQLLYHVGVSVEMAYSPVGSGAFIESYDDINNPSIENALKYYFKYSQSLRAILKEDYSNSQWVEIMRNELDMAQPVIYGGFDPNTGGHAFVLDGYDSLGFFHVNWGWRGVCNGFYTIDSLAPGGSHFSDFCSALVGIHPMTSLPPVAPVAINVLSSDTTLGTVTGSGTYTALIDTVRILAKANEGYRFIRWSSGYLNNPRSFIAMSSITDTAIFEQLHEDTMSYCGNSTPRNSWRLSQNDATDWGIRLPLAARHTHKKLTAVQLYVDCAALYELRIYMGDTISDATLAYTQNYDIQDNLSQWHTLALDTPMFIPDNQTLWITFHVADCHDLFPANYGRYTGNDDGIWYRDDTGWKTMSDEFMTWLIRAIVTSVAQVHLAVSPNDIYMGDVYGGGFYWPGDNVIINALPKNGYQFSYWSDGSTDNPLTFTITCDTTFIAFFEPMNGIEDIENTELKIETSGLTIIVTLPEGIPSAALYDIQGRELLRFTSQISHFTLPAAGVYLLKTVGYPARKIVITK